MFDWKTQIYLTSDLQLKHRCFGLSAINVFLFRYLYNMCFGHPKNAAPFFNNAMICEV